MSADNGKIRLDSYLAQKGLIKSRTLSAELIRSGQVAVNGQTCEKPAYAVSPEDKVEIKSLPKYVSRGGLKLEKAIEYFGIEVNDSVCIDIGASSGGFTDCLLQHGAKKVYAVDVGTAQLDSKLADDGRVISMEKTDIRNVNIPQAEFITADVSFISLKLVLPHIYRLLKLCHGAVVLIKPQFEAGKANIGKNGIVRDEKVRQRVCEELKKFAEGLGFSVSGVIPSPIEGGDGNREFLMYIVKRKA